MPYVRSKNPSYILRRHGLGDDTGATVLGSVSSGVGGGNYQILSDGSVFDPNGNLVTDFSTLPNSVTNGINALLGGTTLATGASPSATPSASSFLQQYQTPILIAVFVLLGVSILRKK